jgi:hypothetical protein
MVTTHNIQPAATAGAGPDRKVARPARVPDDVIAYRAQSRAQATSAAVAKIQTVFVIALENHNFVQPTGLATSPEQLLGNPAAPYINSLITPGNPNAAHVSFASNYQSVSPYAHPSEPNYIWSEEGAYVGVGSDADPYTSTGTPQTEITATTNLSNLLQQAGISWKSYQEDININTGSNQALAQGQWTVPLFSVSGAFTTGVNRYNGSNLYSYGAKHNPQVFFTSTSGGFNTTTSNPQAQHYPPLQQLLTDLTNNTVAKYNWITPDLYNDMHTALPSGYTYHGTNYTGDQAAIAQGDNFLSQIVPLIMASQAYRNNGMIVLWWDETEGGDDPTYTIPEIVISPDAKGNAYTNQIEYNHSSDLLTMEEIFGVGPCHELVCYASDLSDLVIVHPPPTRCIKTLDIWSLIEYRKVDGCEGAPESGFSPTAVDVGRTPDNYFGPNDFWEIGAFVPETAQAPGVRMNFMIGEITGALPPGTAQPLTSALSAAIAAMNPVGNWATCDGLQQFSGLVNGATAGQIPQALAQRLLEESARTQNLLGCPVSAPTSGSSCNGLYNGTFNGNLTVSSGQNCVFVNGTVTGNVQVNGGNLVLTQTNVGGNVEIGGGAFDISSGTTIGGNLQIQNLAGSAGQNQVCGSFVNNNLTFQNNGAPVLIGAASALSGPVPVPVLSCAGNYIDGNLTVQNNTAAVSAVGNKVGNNLTVQNNSASTIVNGNDVDGNLEDQNNTGPTQVFNNYAGKNLQCQQNSSITGGGNTAQSKLGQCAAF